MPSIQRHSLDYRIAKSFFYLTWLPWRLFFMFFLHYRATFEDPAVRNIRPPFLMVANHSWSLDPFLLSAAFPFRTSIYPIRFATYQLFFTLPATALFVRAYGAFPVMPGKGMEENLRRPLKFLKDGQVVGIFPQGKRVHKGRPPKGKRGAAYLALHTGVPILPMHIAGTKGMAARELFLRKRRAHVRVGSPFYLPESLQGNGGENALNEATDIIMKKISALAG